MTSIESRPQLRLVGGADWGEAPSREAAARASVERENRSAAANISLQPTDPRWVLAARAYAQLQGATLSMERRQRVMRTAGRLGVRPFDASLIIAIVQDRARRGEGLQSAAPTLALVAPPGRRSAAVYWARWIAAVAAAIVVNAFLIWWICG